ncbi:hypothetical protein EXS61_01880 [Candidatus Parcubacteria bacterium]|nr:hypothetical protein [Candidatus Parcubacteria bacterium]
MKNTYHTLVFFLIAILLLVAGLSVLFKLDFKKEHTKQTVNTSTQVTKTQPANQFYCTVDSDCNISYYFCSSGAFNSYRPKVEAYGCEYGDVSITDAEKKMCDLTKEHPTLSYGGAKCVFNKCTALGRTLECKPGVIVQP